MFYSWTYGLNLKCVACTALGHEVMTLIIRNGWIPCYSFQGKVSKNKGGKCKDCTKERCIKDFSLVHGCTEISGCYEYFINDAVITSRQDGDDNYESSNGLAIGCHSKDHFRFCLGVVTFSFLWAHSFDCYVWGIGSYFAHYIYMLGYCDEIF